MIGLCFVVLLFPFVSTTNTSPFTTTVSFRNNQGQILLDGTVSFLIVPLTTTSSTTTTASTATVPEMQKPILSCNQTNTTPSKTRRLFAWPPSPEEMAHDVICHSYPYPQQQQQSQQSDFSSVCIPSHLTSASQQQVNPLIHIAALSIFDHTQHSYARQAQAAADDDVVALVEKWERNEVKHSVGVDGNIGEACEWIFDERHRSPISPPPSPDTSIFGLIRNAASIAVKCAEIAVKTSTGRMVYRELMTHSENVLEHPHHLPSYKDEILARKGDHSFQITTAGKHLPYPYTPTRSPHVFSENDVIRILREGDAHDRCIVQPTCTWEPINHLEAVNDEEVSDIVTDTEVISRFTDGSCRCARVFDIQNFEQRDLLDFRAFFASPTVQDPLQAISLLELETSVGLDATLAAASEACLGVDMAEEISVMVNEQLETTFVVSLVQLAILPIVIALLMPLIAKIFGIILPPVINSLMSIFEQFVKPPFEKAMKLKPEPLMGPVTKRNGGEVGELFEYFQHHREATMYNMMGLGDFLDLNPFVAIAVWWIADMISDTLLNGSQNRISGGMGGLLPTAVKNTVPAVLTDMVVKLQGQEIARRVAHTSIHEVTHGVTHGVAHSLSRSVTVAVTHNLELSRKHYYYCLYCYYTGAYCQFCTTYNEWAQEGNQLLVNDQGQAQARLATFKETAVTAKKKKLEEQEAEKKRLEAEAAKKKKEEEEAASKKGPDMMGMLSQMQGGGDTSSMMNMAKGMQGGGKGGMDTGSMMSMAKGMQGGGKGGMDTGSMMSMAKGMKGGGKGGMDTASMMSMAKGVKGGGKGGMDTASVMSMAKGMKGGGKGGMDTGSMMSMVGSMSKGKGKK